MAATDNFRSKVVPIMDKVRKELNDKIADEIEAKQTSAAYLAASAVGPDGGMTGMAAQLDTLRHTGEWNKKTVEDYIAMVKKELRNHHINVDAVMEKKMIDYMVSQRMPKSTTEYILRKAAQSTIFYIDQRVRTSSMEDHIQKEGERRYSPSMSEDITGSLLGWAGNAGTTMGLGGLWGQTAMDGVSMGVDAAAHGQEEAYLKQQQTQAETELKAASKKKVTIPKWMYAQMGFTDVSTATEKELSIAGKWATCQAQIYQKKIDAALGCGNRVIKGNGTKTDMGIGDAYMRKKEYEAFSEVVSKEQQRRTTEGKTSNVKDTVITEEAPADTLIDAPLATTSTETNTVTGDYSGWNNLLDSLGLSGIGDTTNHLGYTLAMLPDMLLGIFTGKTKSIGLNKGSLMPLAALISGTFIKNPLLKIPLMLWGGANLVNKMGQEALTEQRQEHPQTQYKQYADEELNARIKHPQVEGNVLVVDIDNTPRVITLPSQVAEAYKAGAIPLNTLANRILSKADQMAVTQQTRQTVSENYEQGQQREQVRGIR